MPTPFITESFLTATLITGSESKRRGMGLRIASSRGESTIFGRMVTFSWPSTETVSVRLLKACVSEDIGVGGSEASLHTGDAEPAVDSPAVVPAVRCRVVEGDKAPGGAVCDLCNSRGHWKATTGTDVAASMDVSISATSAGDGRLGRFGEVALL